VLQLPAAQSGAQRAQLGEQAAWHALFLVLAKFS